MPTIEETIAAADKSANTMVEHAKKVLTNKEDLLLYSIYCDRITQMAIQFANAGKHNVWREILASMNHMEANAEKFFGKKWMEGVDS